MKRIIITAALLIAAFTIQAQNARKDATGNYTAINHAKEPGKATGKTFTDTKGTVYPLFESAKGKLYYMKTSKAGNVYKAYLKTE